MVDSGDRVRKQVTLTNSGTTDVNITQISLVPPDPCSPPDPCTPPDPCRVELIIPCIAPGESTTLTLTCTPPVAGTFGFSTRVAYRTGRTTSALSIPVFGRVL
jgi:hypothetical protein